MTKFYCPDCQTTGYATVCRWCARNLLLDLVAKVARDMHPITETEEDAN